MSIQDKTEIAVIKVLGDKMRKLNLSLIGLATLALTATAKAEEIAGLKDSPHFRTCREESKTKSDDYVADYLVPVTDQDTAPPGAYVAIVYGQKFIAPLYPPANGDIHHHTLGEVILKRKAVYREEMRRCLGYIEFNLALKQNLFIFFD